MSKFIAFIFLGIFSYLLCMNSTENRQSLSNEKENIAYMNFRSKYLEQIGDGQESMVARSYDVYRALIDMKITSDMQDPEVKRRLITMGVCDLDEGTLVLKGFHIEDTVRGLVGKSIYVRKK